jgi:AraC-like DNA-binding protein
MKALLEKIPVTAQESFHCETIRAADFGTPWHFHPEYELTLVLKSSGYRMVGDNITVLSPGDLVFVGSNLPHVWHQDQKSNGSSDENVHAVVVQFLDGFLGNNFLQAPELSDIRRVFQLAGRGLQVKGRTRDSIAKKMQKLADTDGYARLMELLSILGELAKSEELEPVASAGFAPQLDLTDKERLGRVCQHIDDHLAEPLSRQKLAKLAHLSPAAFSRYFHVRTGRTLPDYINELRVGRACRLLLEEVEMGVSQVAFACGYGSLSNFNKRFQARMGMTPTEYREKVSRLT